MRRHAIFAHYDRQNEVKRYVLFYLHELSKVTDGTTFVTTSELGPREVEKLGSTCESVLMKQNAGFDFGMWQHALERIDASRYDELLLTNSSVFGPLWPLSSELDGMAHVDCDFWGLTENFELAWHVQSYFLVFRRRVLESECFQAFWRSVLPYRDKFQVIRSYEVGLTRFLRDHGFVARVAYPESRIVPRRRLTSGKPKPLNPTCLYPARLLDERMPFVKVELLRDNPGNVPLEPVRERMRASGYDMSLVEFDREGASGGGHP